MVFQLLRYINGILEEDDRQKRKDLSLTIPIVFYHGKEAWAPQFLKDLFAGLPEEYQRFLPNFEFLVINLQALTDAQIEALEDSVYIRNIFLVMKHAWENDFFRQNLGKVIIFEAENVRQELVELLFLLTLKYIHNVSSLKEEEIMASTTTAEQRAKIKSTWEMIEEKGIEKGMEKAVSQFILKFPHFSDKEVSQTFAISVEQVRKIRKALSK